MIKIVGRDNESMDSLIRRFKRLCRKEGVLIDLKKNQYYEKNRIYQMIRGLNLIIDKQM